MPGSRLVAYQLMMTNTQGNPQATQLLKSLHKFKSLSFRIYVRPTIHNIAEDMDVCYGTCQQVLTKEQGMHGVAAKFMPRTLTADQKQQHVDICTELQLASDNATFLSRVITGGESWVYGYDPETKQQSSQWKKTHPTKAKNGQTGEKQCQVYAHHFLRHKAEYAQRICPNRPNCEFRVLM
jgi:hypothetical protein